MRKVYSWDTLFTYRWKHVPTEKSGIVKAKLKDIVGFEGQVHFNTTDELISDWNRQSEWRYEPMESLDIRCVYHFPKPKERRITL
jgi:hypothetical protein